MNDNIRLCVILCLQHQDKSRVQFGVLKLSHQLKNLTVSFHLYIKPLQSLVLNVVLQLVIEESVIK